MHISRIGPGSTQPLNPPNLDPGSRSPPRPTQNLIANNSFAAEMNGGGGQIKIGGNCFVTVFRHLLMYDLSVRGRRAKSRSPHAH